MVLEDPSEASTEFHADWTIVPGSAHDTEKWELEQRLRESRNRLIHEKLKAGRSVFYKSSGNSMWPLVQAHDACTFHPIQAVTATEELFAIQKEESEIDVGDIVFCQVQPSNLYYGHIVLTKKQCVRRNKPIYWIGNIQQRCNGWCYREHILGVLVKVQVSYESKYYPRPLPKSVYAKVLPLVLGDRWTTQAGSLCAPDWASPSGPEIVD